MQGNYEKSLELSIRGMNDWRQVLVEFENFHHTDRSDRTEEETYELLMKMADLAAKELERPDGKKKLEVAYARATAAFGGLYPAAGKVDLDRAYAEDEVNARISALDRRVQERVEEILGSIKAFSPLAFAADDATRGKPARSALARQIVEREFAWLKMFSKKDSPDKAWVRSGTASQVRSRLGLSRQLPPENDPGATNEEVIPSQPSPANRIPGQPGG